MTSTENTLTILNADGNPVTYIPKSLNSIELFIGSVVTLPYGEKERGDTWHGSFNVTVKDSDTWSGDIMCQDESGEWFVIEADRVTVGEISDDEVSRLTSERDARLKKEWEDMINSQEEPIVDVAATVEDIGEDWNNEEKA
jgi:hypothetical protein